MLLAPIFSIGIVASRSPWTPCGPDRLPMRYGVAEIAPSPGRGGRSPTPVIVQQRERPERFDTTMDSTLCFAFRGNQLLVCDDGSCASLPTIADLRGYAGTAVLEEAFQAPEGLDCRAMEIDATLDPPPGMAFHGLRSLYGRIQDRHFALAGRAFQLLEWSRGHRYCGRCGQPTIASPREPHAKECTACGSLHFPRLSPAIIVAVHRGDELLLARSPHFQPGVYSTVAGFVEPGESLEEAVFREVKEEVGVDVTKIRYFGSQPWPFPHSIMIGFTAEYAGGELRPDKSEIEDAGWFTIDRLPLVPARLSIARWLIEHFVNERGGDPNQLRSYA